MVGTLAVLCWPAVVFWLFANRNPAVAFSWSVLGAYLLLPLNFSIDLPAVPTIDKTTVAAFAVMLASAALLKPDRLRALPPGMILPGFLPRSRAVRILFILMLLGVIGTVLTNGDVLRIGPRFLPSLKFYDLLSQLGNALFGLLTFMLARKYLAHPEAQKQALIVLALAGLAYSLPALYEVRMSPQLSRMIYGYFPHDWRQHVRAGGYRPVVFLPHGLWLAIFFCSTLMAILALWRTSTGQTRTRWLLAAIWMFMSLVLSKGVGSLGIALLMMPIVILLPVRLQMIAAAAIAGIVLTYPMLRGAGLVPTGQVVALAEQVDTQRAGSLEYRLRNEDMLLDKANQRPLFGWGAWGRNRVFNEKGQDISVTDGYWVMRIGIGGWIGYIAQMGLLTIPIIFLGLRWRKLALTPATAGLSLALAANLIDLIPNAGLSSATWLMAGALAGRLELGRLPDTDAAQVQDDALPVRRNAYSRQRKRHPAHVPDPSLFRVPG